MSNKQDLINELTLTTMNILSEHGRFRKFKNKLHCLYINGGECSTAKYIEDNIKDIYKLYRKFHIESSISVDNNYRVDYKLVEAASENSPYYHELSSSMEFTRPTYNLVQCVKDFTNQPLDSVKTLINMSMNKLEIDGVAILSIINCGEYDVDKLCEPFYLATSENIGGNPSDKFLVIVKTISK